MVNALLEYIDFKLYFYGILPNIFSYLLCSWRKHCYSWLCYNMCDEINADRSIRVYRSWTFEIPKSAVPMAATALTPLLIAYEQLFKLLNLT